MTLVVGRLVVRIVTSVRGVVVSLMPFMSWLDCSDNGVVCEFRVGLVGFSEGFSDGFSVGFIGICGRLSSLYLIPPSEQKSNVNMQ